MHAFTLKLLRSLAAIGYHERAAALAGQELCVVRK
jgi:hypothetical protein